MSCVVYKNNSGYDKSGNDVPYTLNGGGESGWIKYVTGLYHYRVLGRSKAVAREAVA